MFVYDWILLSVVWSEQLRIRRISVEVPLSDWMRLLVDRHFLGCLKCSYGKPDQVKSYSLLKKVL